MARRQDGVVQLTWSERDRLRRSRMSSLRRRHQSLSDPDNVLLDRAQYLLDGTVADGLPAT
jgi:hypothetical protein